MNKQTPKGAPPWHSDQESVFIIAEIGKNFIDSEAEEPVDIYLEKAKKLIDAAAEADADAVKFQTHVVEDEQLPNVAITSPHFSAVDRYSWVKRNALMTPASFFRSLKQHAENRGLTFFSTPMSRKAAQKLEEEVGVPFWKIGSGDIHDYALLDFIAETGKPVIISSGMTSHAELDETVAYLQGRRIPVAVLYCVSKYPAPAEHFNLATIKDFAERYPESTIGFSDHSLGHDIALAAVLGGARIIEKHFSFSRDAWGADHKTSMLPEEFAVMVRAIRNQDYLSIDAVKYQGVRGKELEGAQSEFRPYFNKILVAGREINPGEILKSDAVYAMRPVLTGKTLSAKHFHDVVGKRVRRALKKYEPITDDVLE